MLILAGIGLLAVALLSLCLFYDSYIYGLYLSFYIYLDIWDPIAFFALLTLLLLFLIFTNSGRIFSSYIRHSVQRGYQFTRDELQGIIYASRYTGRFTMGCGIVFFLCRCLWALACLNFEDEGGAFTLTRNIIAAILPLTYALTIAFFIFYPLQVWAENKLNERKYLDT